MSLFIYGDRRKIHNWGHNIKFLLRPQQLRSIVSTLHCNNPTQSLCGARYVIDFSYRFLPPSRDPY